VNYRSNAAGWGGDERRKGRLLRVGLIFTQ
jgi:hypothetical protein